MTELSHMSGAELTAMRHLLGLTRPELSQIIEVREDTLKRWEQGKEAIPNRIWGEIRALLIEHDQLVERMAAAGVPVHIPRTLSANAARPAGWFLAAAARVIAADEDAEIEWV